MRSATVVTTGATRTATAHEENTFFLEKLTITLLKFNLQLMNK